MYNLAYSIIMSLLHSVWQMAFLLLLYFAIVKMFANWPPLAKRNLLLSAIAVQVFSSLVTFCYIFFTSQSPDYAIVNLNWLSPATGISQQWFNYLLIAYLAGMSYKLIGSYLKWRSHLSQMRMSLQKAPAAFRIFTQHQATAFGIKRKVEIWLSDRISSPLTYGFLKPVILFPVALCNQLTATQAEALIVHELTHIRTKDYFFNWLLVVADALYFFNPFVKITARLIRLEREKNCDLTVIDFKYSSVHYAEALLQVAHYSTARYQTSIAAVQNKNELLNRISFFSQRSSAKQSRVSIWPAISLMVVLILFCSLALVNVSNQLRNNELVKNGPIFLNTGYQERLNNLNNNESFAVSTEPIDPATEIISNNGPSETEVSRPTTTEIISPASEKVENAQALAEVQTIDLQPASDLLFRQVAFAPEAEPVVKEMIVTEENSKGEKITKSFTVILDKGEWKVQPQWMYTERALTDSMKALIKSDSTIYRVFPTVQ